MYYANPILNADASANAIKGYIINQIKIESNLFQYHDTGAKLFFCLTCDT